MSGFYVEVRGRAAIWIGGLIFTLVGGVITFLAPQFLQSGQEAPAIHLILIGLGGIFLLFGLGSLGVGMGDLVLSRTNPLARRRWMWWVGRYRWRRCWPRSSRSSPHPPRLSGVGRSGMPSPDRNRTGQRHPRPLPRHP